MRSDYYPWYCQTCVIAVTCMLVMIADHFTASFIFFPISFLLPLSIVARWYSLHAAIVLAIAMMVLRIATEIHWIAVADIPIFSVLTNGIVNLMMLNIIICLIARVAKQRHMLRKFLTLPTLIPICAYCKKIRSESDQWEEVELYITRQTESTFSHGICPECLKIQRDLLRKMKH